MKDLRLNWTTKAIWGMDISKMMSELFIKELTQGIGKTGVKAGVIKIGSGPKMSTYETAVHKAAVVAQKATGVRSSRIRKDPREALNRRSCCWRKAPIPRKS